MADSLVKQTVYLSAKYLNDINDATVGGTLTAVPSGVTGASQGQQTYPGDRLILDDATALGLSDTTIGTLYGGIYMYVGTTSTATASPAVGTAAFVVAANIGVAGVRYVITSDGQPSTAVPTYLIGVFINAITKGNFGWIQIAGVATALFDSTITATTAGSWVSAKASSVVASCFDNAVAVSQLTVAAGLGVSVGAAAASTKSKVMITRGFGRL